MINPRDSTRKRDSTWKRDTTQDEKIRGPTGDVRAATDKPASGDSGGPTCTMQDMDEFATRWQEERDSTHAQFSSMAESLRSELMLLIIIRRRQSIRQRPVQTRISKD